MMCEHKKTVIKRLRSTSMFCIECLDCFKYLEKKDGVFVKTKFQEDKMVVTIKYLMPSFTYYQMEKLRKPGTQEAHGAVILEISAEEKRKD